jgi:hypothetical protein
MTVEFECAAEDIVALNKHYYALAKGRKQLLQNIALTAGISFFIIFTFVAIILTLLKMPLTSKELLLAAIGSLVVFFGRWIRRQSNIRAGVELQIKAGTYKSILGSNRVTVSPDGLTNQSEMDRCTFFWNSIEEVRESEAHIYFQFSPVMFFLIPKRAFGSPQQGAEFLRLVEKYRTEATGTPIPETTKGAWWTQSGVTEAENVQKAGRS